MDVSERVDWKRETGAIVEILLYWLFPPAVWIGKFFSDIEEVRSETRETFATFSLGSVLVGLTVTTLATLMLIPTEKLRHLSKKILKFSLPALIMNSLGYYLALGETERNELNRDIKKLLGS